MTVNPNGHDYQPAPQEDWKYLPIEQAAPGDSIEDPSNYASWTIDTLTKHKNSNAYAFSAGQGTFAREYVLAGQKFWILRTKGLARLPSTAETDATLPAVPQPDA